jgi:Domain of unknown function (DUF3327)
MRDMAKVEYNPATSRRIEELGKKVASAGASTASTVTAVLDKFWRGVEAKGTPLIEDEELAEGGKKGAEEYLVTFLYRDGSGERRNVVVCSHALGWSFRRYQMERFPGTDLWFRTYRLLAGLRTAYWLSPDDSLEQATARETVETAET